MAQYSVYKRKTSLLEMAVITMPMTTIAFILFLIVTTFTGIPIEYSNGSRSGTIVKFSEKGVFWKTWEGQMVLGGLVPNGEGAMVANVWEFSVPKESKNIIAAIENVRDNGGRISLQYKQMVRNPISTASTSYLVNNVK